MKKFSLFCFLIEQSNNIKSIQLDFLTYILQRHSGKTTLLNSRLFTNKIWKTFRNQKSINYLSFVSSIVKYKKICQYFLLCFAFIAYGFFINELKNIFNATSLLF